MARSRAGHLAHRLRSCVQRPLLAAPAVAAPYSGRRLAAHPRIRSLTAAPHTHLPMRRFSSATAPHVVAALEDYDDNGFAVLRGLLSAKEVQDIMCEVEAICRAERGEVPGVVPPEAGMTSDEVLRQYLAIHFPHKISDRVMELVKQRATVDALTQVIGPNVKCMQIMLFLKPPGFPGQAPHQDEYFIPTRDRSLTATWIALDAATLDNGCLWVIPGSHKPGVIYPARQHDSEEFDQAPMCYGFPDQNDESAWVPVELEPGDGLLFNGYLLHKSTPNRSTHQFRRAFANHYMSAESFLPWTNDNRYEVKPEGDMRDVVLVAGTDPYAEYRPTVDVLKPYVRSPDPGEATYTHDHD